MLELFSFPFMQKALLSGILIAVICAIMSFFVVFKRLSFIGVGISHAAFGGVAFAALLGINITWGAIIFSLGMALLIGFMKQRNMLYEDTLIGILFSFSMALGIVFIGLSKNYQADLFSYLFGSILSVTNQDLIIVTCLTALILSVIYLFFKEFLFYSFDEEMAAVHGLPVNILNVLLLSMLALTVVIAIKIVGIILVSALLVIPGATARLLTHRYQFVIGLSLVVAFLSVVLGLVISSLFNISSGASIVLVASIFFAACELYSSLRK